MKKIFISYRRDDSAVFTGRLFDRLTDYYGTDSVFLDIDSIAGSADFREVVEEQIKRCGVFLAIIGKRWAGVASGARRIDDPKDHVRIEVEKALASKKPTIPVYWDEAEPWKATDLPASLEKLAYANACPVDQGRDFDQHVLRLRREINKILFPSIWSFLVHVMLRLLKRNKVAICLFALAALLMFVLRDPIGRVLLTRSGLNSTVEAMDATTFSNGENGVYEIARGLPDRTALVSETDLVKTIRQAEHTFDVYALSGTAFSNNNEAMTDALQKGVKFRIVILDHGDDNRANLESYYTHCGDIRMDANVGKDSSKVAFAGFRRLHRETVKSGKGSIEARWWRGPFWNSFWIRDGREASNALGHIEITYYGDATRNPSIRFGKLSPKMVDSLQEHFEYIWSKSSPGKFAD